MEDKIIFYGAGKNSFDLLTNPPLNMINKLPKIDNAVCFVDDDIDKQGKKLLDIPILSLEEAVNLYKNAKFFLLVGRDLTLRGKVCEKILKAGVPKERIINYVRRTCPYLEYFIVCGYHECAFDGKAGTDCGVHSFKSCCSDYGKNNVEYVPIKDNLEEAFEDFLHLREDIIYRLNNKKVWLFT